VTKPAATKLAPEEGAIKFERIAGPPQTLGLKIDHNRTTHKMLAGDKDGTRSAYIEGRKTPVKWAPK
jgi:hypothetical protein